MSIRKTTRLFVVKRAFGCCEYCMSQEAFDNKSFSIDHIIPTVLGGSDEPENLAFSCQGCNNIKYIKTRAFDPVSEAEVEIFNPREQKWTSHFRWNENFTVIIGTTPTGRASVIALQLNRFQLINQRILYHKAGVHPPLHSLTIG